MSAQAAEPAGGGGGGGGGGGNLFKRKLGPLPMWAWLAIGATIILAYVIIKRQQSSSAADTSTATAAGSTPASDIPQFINQTYTTVTPPAAPTPTTSPTTTSASGGGGTTSTKRPTQITASGQDSGDINQLAGKYGLTEAQLIAANPAFRKIRVHPANSKTKLVPLIGSGLPIPAGTVIHIPPVPVK